MNLYAHSHPVAEDLPAEVPNFNRLAGLYRWMEFFTFGPWLHRSRCAYLAQLRACRHALVLGDGDGRFTARLLRANPSIQIDAVDASPAMLDSLLRRAGSNATRVRVHLQDLRRWQPDTQACDLIVTHFFLDCLSNAELSSLAARLRRVASPSALWIVSEFAIPHGWFGRLVAQPIIRCLYSVFGLLTGLTVRSLPDHSTALRQAGFALRNSRTWLAGLLVSELWSTTLGAPIPRRNITTVLKSNFWEAGIPR